ncbi:MAG: GNAT family N-acetyltransferase [Thermomicrobiales bacterium]
MNPIRGFGRAPQDPLNEAPARLEPRDLARLSLSWSSNYTTRDLEQHLLEHPGLSWWIPSLNEYLVGGPWRHRTEIVVIQELTARLRDEELVEALVAECRRRALPLVVMLDQYEIRRDSFYSRIGFALLQHIIIYELPRLPRVAPQPRHLRFVPLSATNQDDLLRVDHAAFPWLWWNSAAEFAAYAALYGVEIYIGYEQDGTPAAYIGITSYRGWGHLDRIAVIPDRQGTGYGLEALNFAIARLSEHGARRVGLSTQADNIRSQHLYETYGFRRTNGSDYTIYGRWLDEDESKV